MKSRAAASALALCVALSPCPVQAASRCPELAAVQRAVARLAPEQPDEGFDLEEEAAETHVEDLGPRYRVTVAGREREYDDPSRNCQRRADTAAVFVALVLWPMATLPPEDPPPKEETPQPGPPTPAPPEPRDTAPVPVARTPKLWLEGGVSAELGLASGGSWFRPAGEFAVSFLPGPIGAGLLGSASLAASSVELGAASSELRRYLLVASARWLATDRPVRVAIDAGGGAAWNAFARLADSGSVRGWEGVLRGSATLSFPWKVSPSFGVAATWTPRPSQLALRPTGVVAESPAVWLSAVLGAAFALD